MASQEGDSWLLPAQAAIRILPQTSRLWLVHLYELSDFHRRSQSSGEPPQRNWLYSFLRGKSKGWAFSFAHSVQSRRWGYGVGEPKLPSQFSIRLLGCGGPIWVPRLAGLKSIFWGGPSEHLEYWKGKWKVLFLGELWPRKALSVNMALHQWKGLQETVSYWLEYICFHGHPVLRKLLLSF